jgi:hypothetical protein
VYRPSPCQIPLRSALVLIALTLGSLAGIGTARADDPLGLYVGGAYGQGHISAQLDGLSFDSTNTAFQAMVGIRPISFLGAEISYMDLGNRSIYLGPGATGQASQKGEAAFAMLYLPVPVIDVYVKAGLSHITTDASFTYAVSGVGSSGPYSNSSDVGFAYGAGLQWKLGQWAVRGEYERFNAAGGNPSLLSIGMTYWF